MYRHYELVTRWGVGTYFADPYTAWQHRNQRAPQRSDPTLPTHTHRLPTVIEEELQEIITEINNQPRQHLDQAAPAETYQHHTQPHHHSVALQTRTQGSISGADVESVPGGFA